MRSVGHNTTFIANLGHAFFVDPMELSSSALIFGSRSIDGALTGDPAAGDTTLKFSLLAGVRPMIETMALEQAREAYAHMLSGKARFRVVLTM
jgi:propanol-preferring alcohol dehydrogenase